MSLTQRLDKRGRFEIVSGDYLIIWQAKRIMKPQAKALKTKAFMRPLKKDGHGVYCPGMKYPINYSVRCVKSFKSI